MSLEKQIKKELEAQGASVAKGISVQYIIIIAILSQIVVIVFSVKGIIFPERSVISTIIGICAQIISALYGITLAGYTFFLSRMDSLTAVDATLDYIVQSVKKRFKTLILIITITVAFTLFTSIMIMYMPELTAENHVVFYRLVCNESLMFMMYSIILILYYSIKVIDPNCLEKEAEKLKKKISRQRGPEGNVIDFISMYDKIEAYCNAMIPANVLEQIRENKGKRFEYTIELLYEIKPMMRPIIPELVRVHRYYECVVNCSPKTVTQEMCATAQKILRFLETESQRSKYIR